MTIHATLAAGGWQRLTLAEQLANVGSEVDRAIRAWQGRRSDRFDRALDRALELYDQGAQRLLPSLRGPGAASTEAGHTIGHEAMILLRPEISGGAHH